MYDLRSLAISRQHDLGIRAIVRGLLGQGCQLGRSCWTSPLEVAPDGGGIIDPLHSKVVTANRDLQGVEEGRAREGADVARLDGTTGEDDGHGSTFAELVFCICDVTTSGEGVAQGVHLVEAIGRWFGDWACSDA